MYTNLSKTDKFDKSEITSTTTFKSFLRLLPQSMLAVKNELICMTIWDLPKSNAECSTGQGSVIFISFRLIKISLELGWYWSTQFRHCFTMVVKGLKKYY